jgi:hypothetical protein
LSALAEIEALIAEVRDLRAYKAENDKFVKSLERKLESAEKALRKTREKVATLEARPVVIDGIDEEWLWEHDAQITFKQKFGGGRTVHVDARGRKRVMRHGKASEPLLKEALEDASGRQRGRAADEASPRSSQSDRPARA